MLNHVRTEQSRTHQTASILSVKHMTEAGRDLFMLSQLIAQGKASLTRSLFLSLSLSLGWRKNQRFKNARQIKK